MVNRAIWRKNHWQEQVTASVTGPQSIRLFFVGLSQAESVQSIAKNIRGFHILLDERIRKHSGSNVKKTLF
jgi:hypothetical protein